MAEHERFDDVAVVSQRVLEYARQQLLALKVQLANIVDQLVHRPREKQLGHLPRCFGVRLFRRALDVFAP